MDINDIIGMSSEAGSESTLESEIDALSKIITDTKDGIQKLEENDEDFKLDNDDLSFSASFPCDSEVENDKSDLLQNDNSIVKDILDSSEEIDKFISTSITESNTQQVPDDDSRPDNDLLVNKKCDDGAVKEQTENTELPLASSKSLDQDIVIEPSLDAKPSSVNNSLSLINQEYNLQETHSYSDSQLISTVETQEVVESENKTEINKTAIDKTENVQDSLKIHEVTSDGSEIEPTSNFPTETRDAICESNLVTENTDTKFTEIPLEKNTDELVTVKESKDQSDFVNTVTEIKNLNDTDIFQKEDVKPSHSDVDKLIIKNVTEEKCDSIEVDNEKEEKNDIKQTKILVEEASDSITEITLQVNDELKTTDVSDTMITPDNDNEGIEQNVIGNSVTEINRIVEEAEVNVESDDAISVTEKPLEIEQIKVNLPEDLKISEEKEVSEVSRIVNQTSNEINKENNSLEVECQINSNTNTDVSHSQESQKYDIKESKESDKSTGTNISAVTGELNKEKVVDKNFEESKDSNNKQDVEIVKNIDITTHTQDKETNEETSNSEVPHKDLQKTEISNTDEKSRDCVLVENINISKETVSNETLESIVTDINIEDSRVVESITKKVQPENDDSTVTNDDQIVVSYTVSPEDKNKIEDTNIEQSVTEKLLSIENNDEIDEKCTIMKETENINETVNNLIENSSNSNIILNTAETSIDSLTKQTEELTEKEPVQNTVSTILDETEDQNLTLELTESQISEKNNLAESTENVEESNAEKENKIEAVVEEQIFLENLEDVIPEETEDPVEINLSLDPDGDSSPISHDVIVEQMVTDPLNKLIESQNIIDNKSPEKVIDPVSSDILDTNQNIDEILSDQQVLDSQELTSLNEPENDLGSDLDILLNTEENSNKETAHFANSETSNLPDKDFQSLDEKSQDSLSILNALQSEPISIDQDKENNKFESTEKEDEISLMFNESSQSPRNTESDQFVNDLYNNCVPDDTIDSNDAMVENIEECNEPLSTNEQNDEINREIKEDAKVVLSLDNDTQSEDIKAPEDPLKDFLNNEATIIEDSAEISELESAVKFLQESEEQDIQNSRIVQNININEQNSSVFVAVDDSICDNTSELVSDLPETTLDPIAISEAEIISEAAKLENERKEKLQLEQQLKSSEQESSGLSSSDVTESQVLPSIDNLLTTVEPSKPFDVLSEVPSMDTLKVPLLRQTKLTSTILPEASLLDERYKEPPKIEIPEISPPLPSTPRASLLIQKDAKQRLESPDRLSIYSEPKITDTPKKDSDKQQQYLESENIGSPRIILKIAKSAIAECSEPRSPKSPKIRSAANSPNPDDSPGQKLGKIKLKLSKGGHPSIIPNNDEETVQWHTDSPSSASPLGMKIKLSKSGDASVVESVRGHDEIQKLEEGYKPETPIGMKIKLSKSGDASIVQHDNSPKESIEGKLKHKDTKESAQEVLSTKKQDSPSIGMKIKLSKSGDASIIQQDVEEMQDSGRRTDSPIGMKIKLSKSGDASVVPNELTEDTSDKTEEPFKRTDSPMGVRIKLAKTKSGNPSIISSETIEEFENSKKNKETEALGEESTKVGIGMKIKLSKSGDASVIREDSSIEPSRKSGELPIGMKIKLSKNGEPSIIHTDTSKKSHSDASIESVKNQPTVADTAMIDLHNKRKEITISPVESKKAKVDANLKQMLPDITIQPVASSIKKDQQKLMLDPNASNISRQQMNVINQEISITQICSLSTGDTLMGDRLKNALSVQTDPSSSSPLNSDCEIIEPQPELIIVNENSNSSQDIMIIEEVPPPKSLVKIPKKRGRPRRNAVPATTVNVNMPSFQEQFDLQRDPLSLDQPPLPIFQQKMHEQMNLHQLQQQLPGTVAGEGSERPRRTCRSQKSYAPPKRGRGRGRGKRKNDATDIPMKKQRIEQDLTAIENSTTAVIALKKLPIETSPELFRALNQPTLERIIGASMSTEHNKDIELMEIPNRAHMASTMPPHQRKVQAEIHRNLPEKVADEIEISEVPAVSSHLSTSAFLPPSINKNVGEVEGADQRRMAMTSQLMEKSDTIIIKVTEEDDKQQREVVVINEQTEITTSRNDTSGQQHQNWLAPSIRKVSIESTTTRTESTMSTLTVIDEETRMSAESCSRSQTPARNISVPGTSEAVLVNEESQGSTATTESEKVKVKNRRLEINFDPDEGPFTVEKIAEYEWPPKDDEARSAATRAETFMIQEQISQYLGVKSFKRKYPDLKRRMVDMEERNFLRENGLVSESMCDMGLTAVSSSEVLDIMCSDFPEQYEEYRKHMREKAAKEHSKKQKELSAAANAERNRIDLAEMAMQSTLNWNVGLNKARRESRRCSLDLQTFTVHMPKRPIKFDPSKRGNHYPVALIPGQYTDYYREYTPAELRYYPLNTVLYGPMRPNERKFDSQSEGSQSDSDSDSSSDDSSSSSSEGTQDTEGSQSTMDEVDMELAIQSDIKCKMCLNHLNKSNRPEVLIQCGTCSGNVHPSCIDLTLDMVPHIRAYAWQCTDCKTCAQCHDPADEDKMLFCDMCDRGYHIYCVGLRRVPQGRWHCQECAVCANCGSKEPGGANSDRNSVAQWQHEYKKADKNTRVYVSTFCVPCSKLWRKGRYCPHCSRCHNAPRLDLEPNLVHCGACDKYLHLGCVETKGLIIDKKNYLCEFCSPNRQHLVKPLISKTFKT